MKVRFVLLITLVMAAAAGTWIIRQIPVLPDVEIELSSAPFPMGVGPTTLDISLRYANGAPVEGARLWLGSQMVHAGTLPVERYPQETAPGEYSAAVTWPMAGQWNILVSAELPSWPGAVQEQFNIFVYAVPPRTTNPNLTYRSVREVNATLSADPEKELWIIIPMGTKAMIGAGEGADLIPAEIRLQASGRNILNIRNDDIADHTIGPFFVRAGETIRQEFTQPAEFEGTCTVRHQSTISIIVDA